MKKWLIYVLLSAMLLQGCNTKVENTTADTTATVQDAVTTEAETEYTLPTADYDGYTFTIAGRELSQNSWSVLAKNPYVQEEQTGEVIDDALWTRQDLVQNSYNVTMAYFPFNVENPNGVINSLLAGDNAYDTVECNAWYISKFLNYGNLFVDYLATDIVDLTNSWWEQKAIDTFSVGGKLYVLTGDALLLHPVSLDVLYLNKQMVEDYQLEDPYTLVKNGQWTLDAMQNMSMVVAGDLNGDGKMYIEDDAFGLMASDTSLLYFIQGAGFRITEKDADDLPSLCLYNEKNADILSKVQTILQDTSVNYNSALIPAKKSVGEAFYNLVLPSFKEGRGLFHFNWIFIAMDLRDMEIDFGMLPMPKQDAAQTEYRSINCTNWDMFTMVPNTGEDGIHRAGNILEALGYYGKEYVTPAVLEKSVYTKSSRDEESKEMLDIICSTVCYDAAAVYDWGGMIEFFRNFGNKTNAQFASAYAANESKMQEAMNATIEAMCE